MHEFVWWYKSFSKANDIFVLCKNVFAVVKLFVSSESRFMDIFHNMGGYVRKPKHGGYVNVLNWPCVWKYFVNMVLMERKTVYGQYRTVGFTLRWTPSRISVNMNCKCYRPTLYCITPIITDDWEIFPRSQHVIIKIANKNKDLGNAYV